MLRVFQNDIVDPDHFVITLELVPGRESQGRSVDLVTGIARDALLTAFVANSAFIVLPILIDRCKQLLQQRAQSRILLLIYQLTHLLL